MKSLTIVSKGLAPYRVRYYKETAAVLQSRGWKVSLLAAVLGAKDHPWNDLRGGGDSLRIVPTGQGVENSGWWRTLSKFKMWPQDLVMPRVGLFDALQAENPDVVWAHEYSPFCLAASAWARLKNRISVLSTDLGDDPPPYSCTPGQKKFHRSVSGLYQAVIAQTMEATRRTHPSGAPIHFAPHAISTEEYHPHNERPASASPRPFRFLFTGALDDRKGINRLITAAEALAGRNIPFQLRVLGTGPLSAWLHTRQASWLSIGGFVEGEALRQEYRNADAYVLPTSGDTYAVTVHEAAASGLPLIIGSTAGAVETLVAEGITGYAIPAHDIRVLEDRMERLLKDPLTTHRMGSAARAAALPYDVARLGRQTADFIESLR